MAKVIYAKAKYIRRSPRKTRLVVDMIRGKEAGLAADMLRFTNKAATLEVLKTLNSAVANAVNNSDMDKEKLFVVEAFVNEAPTYKRGKAVSRGRYHQIFKRNSHIVIGVSEDKEAMNTRTVKSEASAKTEKEKTVKSEKKTTKTKVAAKTKTAKTKTTKTKTKTSAKKTAKTNSKKVKK